MSILPSIAFYTQNTKSWIQPGHVYLPSLQFESLRNFEDEFGAVMRDSAPEKFLLGSFGQ